MYIYWLHLPQHTDLLTEGYIGVSKNPKNRFKTHKNRSGNKHLYNSFKKYNTILMDIILEGNEKYCLFIEEVLRPEKNIGWNITKGGGKPPELFGHKHNKGKTPWNKGLKTGPIPENKKQERYKNLRKPQSDYQKKKVSEALSGVPKIKVTCPNCGKIGGKPAMLRFHFDKCKSL